MRRLPLQRNLLELSFVNSFRCIHKGQWQGRGLEAFARGNRVPDATRRKA